MAKAPADNSRRLVIVESPTKARTIRKFLGKGFVVESCMGHVRDLPQSAKDIPDKIKKEEWANLGVNVDDGFDPVYCIPKTKTRIVKDLKDKLKDADELILATDEDREGESISWHLIEVLKPRVPVKRMVFHEITKEAINHALGEFREIDENLVRAQEARRILDRLVGYTISPLLWKKVAYGLSAGRVQSVAVRLIAEREHQRMRFVRSKYWGIAATCEKSKVEFEARLLSVDDKRVALGRDFDANTGQLSAEKQSTTKVLDEAGANKLITSLKGKKLKVLEVEEKPVSRKPYPPFITSTLQQEANRKLGFSSRDTMEVAQKLYERGFITYMRTDSTNLSQQAIDAARDCIKELYGKEYLPDEPRDYSGKKAKGAQEAHEAIRPAGTQFVRPEETGLSGTQFKLYELIWKRTVASQMVNARQKQVSVKLAADSTVFSTSGMTIEFPGYLKAYVEGSDDPEAGIEDREVRLPQLAVGDVVDCREFKPTDHETKPPPRFTEATLVQTMEKEGIGRPSTYAAIIGTIQDRGYVRKVSNALVPTFTALVVSKLLSTYLPNYVDTNFTSEMEKSLDDIAGGDLDHKLYLKRIYFGDQGLKTQVSLQEKRIKDNESRAIELEGLKGLNFRIGRYGAYVCRLDKKTGEEVCASLPDNQFPGDISADVANKLIDQKVNGADALGKDPETGQSIFVLSGRYGPYVQLGDSQGENTKPKRMALPATLPPENVTLEQALHLLELPKKLGNHPDSGKEIKKGLGRFGPYVVHDGDFRSIPKTEDFFKVGISEALALLAQPKRVRGRSQPLMELGKHPESQEPINVFTGKYGPYVKCGKVNASLPDDMKPESVTLELAIQLVDSKMGGAKKKAKGTGEPKRAKAATEPKKTKSKPVAKAEKKVKNPVAIAAAGSAKKRVVRRVAAEKAQD
ncbi:MAG: type I DNA topoisomerase [Bdellovibrionales bacterium]|nr:type I DNA topoisomerase [Bdellovibrionales bacterium]